MINPNDVLTYEQLKAKCDALEKQNTAMRDAIEFATAPDMWIERDGDIFEYRYVDWYVDVLNASLEIEPEQPPADNTPAQFESLAGGARCKDA